MLNQKTIEERKVAVIGGGSWATAIAKILTSTIDSKIGFNWYIRDEKVIRSLIEHHHNPNYLRSVSFNTKEQGITLYNDIGLAINDSDILIFAIPAAFLKKSLQNHIEKLKDKFIISSIKGIIPEDNLIVGEFFNQVCKIPIRRIAVVSGPCHAEEVALERLSYLTIGSRRLSNANEIAKYFTCRYIKTRVSRDIYGIEYSAVLKNIFALASGICHGLGYGDNFQSVLISNAMQEIRSFVKTVKPTKRNSQARILFRTFVKKVQPFRRNLNTSVYLGDLLVTAYSQFSRNRTFGNMIGKGYSVKSAQLEMDMVAEGYYATKSIREINKKYKVNMPISEAVYNILYKGNNPEKEMKILGEKLL